MSCRVAGRWRRLRTALARSRPSRPHPQTSAIFDRRRPLLARGSAAPWILKYSSAGAHACGRHKTTQISREMRPCLAGAAARNPRCSQPRRGSSRLHLRTIHSIGRCRPPSSSQSPQSALCSYHAKYPQRTLNIHPSASGANSTPLRALENLSDPGGGPVRRGHLKI